MYIMTTHLFIILLKNELEKTPQNNFNGFTREIRYRIHTIPGFEFKRPSATMHGSTQEERQGDQRLDVNLDYSARPCLQKKKKV